MKNRFSEYGYKYFMLRVTNRNFREIPVMKYDAKLAFEALEKQHAWQSTALKELLGYLQNKSPFYQRIFKEHHININNIKTLNDLQCSKDS